MIIQWFGHSSFLIIASNGTKIITDPYNPGAYGETFTHKPIEIPPDIVTVSHDHADHSYTEGLPGQFSIISKPGSTIVKGITFKGIETYHDAEEGSTRGKNVVFCMSIDSVRICHLGDLGQMPTPIQAEHIGSVDILMIPVGGHFTIDAEEADRVIDLLHSKIVIPIHFRNDKVNFPIAPVDEFLRGKQNVRTFNSSGFEISKEMLPEQREIVVLKHAL